jgi:hypothetical protein
MDNSKVAKTRSVAESHLPRFRYCDNTDKKRSSRPLISKKVDLPVAQFLSLLDIRFVEADRSYEVLIRARHYDGEIARTWMPDSRLDEDDDECEDSNKNKLIKLIDLFQALSNQIQISQPELKDFYRHKSKLFEGLRHKITSKKVITENNEKEEVENQNESNDYETSTFFKKYGGKINTFTSPLKRKKELYRKFVTEYCEDRIATLKEGLAQNETFSSLQFIKAISYLRRQFEFKYNLMVVQKMKEESRK